MTVHKRKILHLSLMLVLSLVLVYPVSAQTTVSGPQSGVWTFVDSPYQVITEDISVEYGDTLIIEAGVQVVFYPDREFNIIGTLLVQGIPEDSVSFSSPGGGVPGSWAGIKFSGAGSSGSMINCAKIEWGMRNIWIDGSSAKFNGIHCHGSSRYGIVVEDGIPEFRYFMISNLFGSEGNHSVYAVGGNPYFLNGKINHINSDGNCMLFSQNCRPTVLNCQMRGSTENGIYANEIPSGLFQYNTVTEVNLRGYYIHNASNVELSYNTAYNLNGSGIYVQNGNAISVHNNTVMDSEHDGVLLAGSDIDIDYHSNIVSNCLQYGINASGGANVWSTYSCYSGNMEGTYGGGAMAGAGDIEEDPLFIAPWIGDFRLQPLSPCIDSGNPAMMIYSDPDGTRLDMGAFFYNQNHPPEVISHLPNDLLLTNYAWGEEVNFSVEAVDRNEDELAYRWYDRGILVSETETLDLVVTHRQNDPVWVEIDDGLYEGIVTVTWSFDAVEAPENQMEILPEQFEIMSIFPNPFNPATNIKVAIDQPGQLRLNVYDILGRQVYSDLRQVSAGIETVNLVSNNWASGLYFIQASINDKSDVKKMIFSK